jgi:Family of unknown function (DUF1028)
VLPLQSESKGRIVLEIELDEDGRLVADDPGIVPRLDGHDLRRDELVRAAVRVLHVHLALEQEADVRELAAVGPADGPHVAGPSEPRGVDDAFDAARAGRSDVDADTRHLVVLGAANRRVERIGSVHAPHDTTCHAGRRQHPVDFLLMRHTVVLLAMLLAVPSSAWATWSVIAVDRSTGRVVIASATCVDRDDQFLMGVQAVVVPGKGVAACQAAVDGTHANQMLVYRELQKGTDPERIIEMLSEDPAFQSRQFGILDLQGRAAGHSGLGNGYVSQDAQGQVPGTDIFYSIQGNILRPGQVVPNAVQALINTKGALTDRVMAAMEAADGSGGDSRCTCPPWPTDGTAPPIPCDGRTSHVAYILMAEARDASGDSHNNGTYAMYLTVSQPGADKGAGQIRAGENLNPVKTLRARYDAWRTKQPATFR